MRYFASTEKAESRPGSALAVYDEAGGMSGVESLQREAIAGERGYRTTAFSLRGRLGGLAVLGANLASMGAMAGVTLLQPAAAPIAAHEARQAPPAVSHVIGVAFGPDHLIFTGEFTLEFPNGHYEVIKRFDTRIDPITGWPSGEYGGDIKSVPSGTDVGVIDGPPPVAGQPRPWELWQPVTADEMGIAEVTVPTSRRIPPGEW